MQKTPSVVRGSHARQTSTTTANGLKSRTAHTATGGLLARGAAAKIATLTARLSAGCCIPVRYPKGAQSGQLTCRAGRVVGEHGEQQRMLIDPLSGGRRPGDDGPGRDRRTGDQRAGQYPVPA